MTSKDGTMSVTSTTVVKAQMSVLVDEMFYMQHPYQVAVIICTVQTHRIVQLTAKAIPLELWVRLKYLAVFLKFNNYEILESVSLSVCSISIKTLYMIDIFTFSVVCIAFILTT